MKSLVTVVTRFVLVVGLGFMAAQTAVAQYLAPPAVATYSKTILADKPVAYYRLGEAPGSTAAVDSSPSGLNGTYEGSPQLGVPGLINDPNTAVDFTNGDVLIDDNPALDFVSVPFSIEAWINATQFSAPIRRIFDKLSPCDCGPGYGLDVSSIDIRMLGDLELEAFPISLTSGTTYHVVGVSNGKGKGFIYLNGVLIKSGPYTDSAAYSGSAHIALASDGSSRFQGVIDEVAIYNKALPAGKILAHYSAGTGVKLSPKVLNFGKQMVGTTGPAKLVVLTNVNSGTLGISAIVATGDFTQTNDCPANLSTNAHCTISVFFTPTKRGFRLGTVSVTDNFPGSPQQVSLKGKGI